MGIVIDGLFVCLSLEFCPQSYPVLSGDDVFGQLATPAWVDTAHCPLDDGG